MRNLKKVLTLVLTVAMLLSVMVVGTGAAFSDQDSIKNKEAVDVCVALNIIGGMEDGSYRPANNVTRAQMCKMICVALNGGKEPTLGTNATPTFSDVRTDPSSAWAESFIESCYSQGIVSGVGSGRFNPSGSVTGTQAARMLLVALGFNAENEKFTGDSWDINVNVRATQKGLYKDIEGIDPNAALNRDNAAQMIKNALDATMVSYNNEFTTGPNGQLVATPVLADKVGQNGQTITLLRDRYDAVTATAQMTGFSYDSNKAEWTYTIATGTPAVGSTPAVANLQVKSTTDYTALLGQNVDAIYDTTTSGTVKDAYGIYASDSTVILTGVVGNLPALNNTDTSFRVDGTTYRLEAGKEVADVAVYQFSSNMATFTADDLATLAGKDNSNNVTEYDYQRFEAIDQDGNGRIDFFMIYPVTVAKVTTLTSSKITLSAGGVTNADREDMTIYDGVSRNDWVVYTDADNTANDTGVIEKADLVSGKITEVSDSDITIDGSVYTIDDSYVDGNSNKVTMTVGSTLTDAVVYNGYVFASNVNAASASAEDYIVAVSNGESSFGTVSIRAMFSDGTKTTIALDQIDSQDATTSNTTNIAGKMYTFNKNSSDEYSLKSVTPPTDSISVGKISNSSDKVGFIGSNAVNDDSVIFVAYNKKTVSGEDTYSYDVIKGSVMKTMNVGQNKWTVSFVQKSDNAATGVGSVNVAYVIYGEKSLSISDTYFGYITKVTNVQNENNREVSRVTLWTKDGSTTLNTTTDNDVRTAAVKGDVVSYTLNSDGELNKITKITDAKKITAKTSSSVWIDGTAYDLTDDTVILGVNITDVAGDVENGTWEDLTVEDVVYYKVNTDNEVELIVYATDGTITASSAN